jgi:hypothetical protein
MFVARKIEVQLGSSTLEVSTRQSDHLQQVAAPFLIAPAVAAADLDAVMSGLMMEKR